MLFLIGIATNDNGAFLSKAQCCHPALTTSGACDQCHFIFETSHALQPLKKPKISDSKTKSVNPRSLQAKLLQQDRPQHPHVPTLRALASPCHLQSKPAHPHLI